MAKSSKSNASKTAQPGADDAVADNRPAGAVPTENPASLNPPPAPSANQAERARRQAARQAERAARQAANRAERTARKNAVQPDAAPPVFDILIVAQGGGIDRQAAMLLASLRHHAPDFRGRVIVAEPQPDGAWDGHDPHMSDAAQGILTDLGADIRPLHAQHFGASYPHGNKIEALGLLDPDRPFLFLDSDTVLTGNIDAVPFDFSRPSASMRRDGTWPVEPLYGPDMDTIWQSLYDRFGLDMDASRDAAWPVNYWKHYLYFNAGWFFDADPKGFADRFLTWARAVRDAPGDTLACQVLDPWLDQAVLPLVIHSFGGGRPGPELDGLDGDVSWHYRNLPLLYARAPEAAVAEVERLAALPLLSPLIDGWEPAQRLIRDGVGRAEIWPLRGELVGPEDAARRKLKKAGLWLR